MLKLFRKKYKPFSNLTHLALTASDLHARECKVKRDYGRFELLTFYTIYIIWLSRYFSSQERRKIPFSTWVKSLIVKYQETKKLEDPLQNHINIETELGNNIIYFGKFNNAIGLIPGYKEEALYESYLMRRGRQYTDEIFSLLSIGKAKDNYVPMFTARFDAKSLDLDFLTNGIYSKRADAKEIEQFRCFQHRESILNKFKFINHLYQNAAIADGYKAIESITNLDSPFSSLIETASEKFIYYPYQKYEVCGSCGDYFDLGELRQRISYKGKDIAICNKCKYYQDEAEQEELLLKRQISNAKITIIDEDNLIFECGICKKRYTAKRPLDGIWTEGWWTCPIGCSAL